MIIDTSVLIALQLGEPGYERLLAHTLGAEERVLSAFSLYEAASVLLSRRGPSALLPLHETVTALKCRIVPFDNREALTAIDIYEKHGKGVHPDRLNLGDCVVCALAAHRKMPILSTSPEFANAGFASIHL